MHRIRKDRVLWCILKTVHAVKPAFQHEWHQFAFHQQLLVANQVPENSGNRLQPPWIA